MGWKTKANFTVEDEKAISSPPTIKFDAPSGRPAAAPTPAAPAPAAPGAPGYS
jgi:LemA protein